MSINDTKQIKLSELHCTYNPFRSKYPLVRSFRKHGVRQMSPILVVSESLGYRVVGGLRRVAALKHLEQHERETLTRILPDGTLTCCVLQHS